MNKQIFISYRREDSSASAGRLFDRLTNHFPSYRIFLDVDSIDLGEDFVKTIKQTVESCDVLIAVIGKGWLSSCDHRGQRRLDNQDDFVRIEISTALKRHIRVIPVLVDDALMPRFCDLPDDLKALVHRQALELSHDRFRTDSERLASAVERALENLPCPQVIDEEKAITVLEKARKDQPWLNSLGMKFVPVKGTQVLFSVWVTRVQDFSAFVDRAGYDATGRMWSVGKDSWRQRGATWKDPGFKQGPTDPVVGVSWEDAKAFCAWLTKQEHASGTLPTDMQYRLPTDEEWSVAVLLDSENGKTPEEKQKSSTIKFYLWGEEWPPPPGAGNYCGVESRIGNEPKDWPIIGGYNDVYPRTNPVGSFAANQAGLYDMEGNVWEWCEDWYNWANEFRVLRGASWSTYDRDRLLASYRGLDLPDSRRDYVGFRCVVVA
jgi:hypothetical protein